MSETKQKPVSEQFAWLRTIEERIDFNEIEVDSVLPLLSAVERLEKREQELMAEVQRLKDGRLTAEEFNMLCHNQHERGCPITWGQHEAECLKFRCQLFGRNSE